ncbi:MAG: methylenetetrahydrofolate reductase [NAD(P)H] [Bacteroidales bacterium]|nr:methylenetetrahydrofolate reductase [NAD(P)H] [Bacteroidales bacterium]
MDSVASFLASDHPTAFSFEILPPIRGNSIDKTLDSIKPLLEFNPAYVNITTHRTEVSYTHVGGGTYRAISAQKRPGTVAIAAVLKERFGIRPVPHIICGDYGRREIEDQLIDLSYLGITDVLALRGDRERNAASFSTSPDGHIHASTLARQIVEFNEGIMADGSCNSPLAHPFSFGVAGYPEKHEEAMNLDSDLIHLKTKVDNGASYIVTQMFFDNKKYFDFVERCRAAGIDVPIIPGIKPLTSLRQMSLLPRIFHIDFPTELSRELMRCTTDDEVRALGVEWATAQAKELKSNNVPSIHFYAMHATRSVVDIAKNIY